jgi:hypothetical protein
VKQAAIDRIHHRLAMARGGTVAPIGRMAWQVTLPEDPEAEEPPSLVFRNEIKIEGTEITVQCDADLGQLTPAQAEMVAELERDLATALKREGVSFDAFAEVAAFLGDAFDATVEEGTVVVPPAEEDDEPVYVSEVTVGQEPWVSLSVAFVDDVDPVWLLEQNALLTHVRFDAFEGEVSLAAAYPLADLTGQRLVELIDDLVVFREGLLGDLDSDDDEEGQEGDEPQQAH